MPTVHVYVYVNTPSGIYKVGEGDIYYTDAYQPSITYTTTQGTLSANIYCNGIKVGEVSGTYEDTVASGSGGTATKTVTFTVMYWLYEVNINVYVDSYNVGGGTAYCTNGKLSADAYCNGIKVGELSGSCLASTPGAISFQVVFQ